MAIEQRRFVSVYSGGDKKWNDPEVLAGYAFGGIDMEGMAADRTIDGPTGFISSYRGTMRVKVSPDGVMTLIYGRGYPENLVGQTFATVRLPTPEVHGGGQ